MLIRLDAVDTVAVCRRAIVAGEHVSFEGGDLIALEDVPQGHKIALCPHAIGDQAIKYGYPIGEVTAAIAPGEHVHVHNLATLRARRRPESGAV